MKTLKILGWDVETLRRSIADVYVFRNIFNGAVRYNDLSSGVWRFAG